MVESAVDRVTTHRVPIQFSRTYEHSPILIKISRTLRRLENLHSMLDILS